MKSSFSCVIIDDEPKAVELLNECLKNLYPNINITGSYTAWEDALHALRLADCDILFIDISMPGKSGIDLLTMLPELECEIIFVTAHSEHALSAIKFAPAGYILKPIDNIQLTNTINKAIARVELRKLAKQNSSPLPAKIGIPNRKGTDYINIDDIICLESVNNCTKVVTTSGEMISSYTLSRFKAIMEKHAFFQVHRSYIINLSRIKRYTNDGSIIMCNELDIPLSRSYKDDFLHKFYKVSKTDD